jgi:UDPglucose 6-dehydrogenase
MKIAVFGLGYVGLSNAVLLAQNHEVAAVDVWAERVEMLNARKSPIVDAELEEFLATRELNLTATLDAQAALAGADFVIVATPTNYDVDTNKFDTSSVESVIRTVIAAGSAATVVVKSTIPVGFIEDVRQRLGTQCHLQPRIPARGQGALRQPPPLAHHRGRAFGAGRDLCRAAAGRRGEEGCRDPLHRPQ